MKKCPGCGKSNQEHFSFCLGCGASMPRDGKPRMGAPGARPSYDATVPKSESGSGCARCGAVNEEGHRFCSSCGHNLADLDVSSDLPPVSFAGPHLTALNPDGSDATAIPLTGVTPVGRSTNALFSSDEYLSPRHASFTPAGHHVLVTDESSLNGVFRRLPPDQRYPLTPGQLFRIGQELIRFDPLETGSPGEDGVEIMGAPVEGYVGKISMVTGADRLGAAFPVPEDGLNIGRERGEVLFGEDGYVSGLHCRISFEDGQVFLTDLGSSNGTFVRLLGSEHFVSGEVVLMGQQLFRISL